MSVIYFKMFSSRWLSQAGIHTPGVTDNIRSEGSHLKASAASSFVFHISDQCLVSY